ncbi:hydrolase [Clostridium sp. JS66]|uniref:hydrolase n=1 Tax=Clostridium sp. JS66 TaxID=3064705 RepID=UPI00298DBF8E|nr:hydrolase [Clostridium sp. JS66]WPC41008.1 hydrolase [Clostridium sp. JS66]
MIKKLKKYMLILFSMFILIAFNSNGVLAAGDNVLDMGTRTITDTNKTWTITFNNTIDFNSTEGNIQIKDLTSGNNLSINPVQGDNAAIVKVGAPSGGYTVGHTYQISLNKNIKLANGGLLARNITLNFIVASKGTSECTISANVMVSPAISIFKQVTITSTNLPNAKKYKVEGNNNLVDIGKSMFSVIGKNTVKVYICDSTGNVLGTADMDVSSTKSNMSLNLQQ